MTEKIKIVSNEDGTEQLLLFWCPGCSKLHSFTVRTARERPSWFWDGNREQPTCNPSLLVEPNRPQDRCHLFLHNGIIQYLNDCHHALAGQQVPLPNIPDDAW